jgi:putative ABC transport system permease protein
MNNSNLPKWPLRFFRWFCHPDYVEDIEGDLLERFEKRKSQSKSAKWLFILDVFRLFRPGIIKSVFGGQNFNHYAMFKHNLIITLRGFKRQKSTLFINLIGLSTGLACVLFIYLWVHDELSIDKYHTNDQHLFQLQTNHHDASGTNTWKGVPGLIYDEIKATIPEVDIAVAATDVHEYTLSTDQTAFKVNGRFASEEFFDAFSFELLSGDKATVLSDQSNIVISESFAKRLFNTTDAIGKSIEFHFWGRTKPVKVAGILKDIPSNSSENLDFIMSWDYYHDELISYKNWGNYYGRAMVVINENADLKTVEAKIDKILKDHQESDNVDVILTKYSNMYLYNNYENGVQAGGRIEYVHLFSIVAIFILLIACINFINLSTANASQKTKEIGVKKSMGAPRSSLMNQFFTESVLLSCISLVLAIGMVFLLLPQFNFLAQKELVLNFDLPMIGSMVSIILIVGILAGSYPAIYLSGMNVLDVLKSRALKSGHSWGRKSLVIIQFSISIVLIVATFLIQQQMKFVQTKNLGYDRDNLLYFEREGKLLESHDAFIDEIQKVSGVERAVASGFMVGGGNSTGGVSWDGKTNEDQVQFWETKSGYGLIETLGIELLQGRGFSKEFGLDTASVIFNETAISAMGLTDPIGKTVWHYTGNKKIIGVVKDFNLISLHTKVEPALFLFNPEETHFIMAKLQKGKELETIANIESVFQSFNPGYPFEPKFVDQDYLALYNSEKRVASLSGYFAGLAVLISCLGLFGLATFTTARRVKEIGIRKVLGSSVGNIVYLLTIDFSKMVFIAILIALPISYFVGSSWLDNFAYSISLEWWFFVGAGILALIVAWLTVSIQTLKAARANPVDSLMDE